MEQFGDRGHGVDVLFQLVERLVRDIALPLPSVNLTAWALAVAAGGWIGAEIGSRRIAPCWIRRMLALVLAIAGTKLALI